MGRQGLAENSMGRQRVLKASMNESPRRTLKSLIFGLKCQKPPRSGPGRLLRENSRKNRLGLTLQLGAVGTGEGPAPIPIGAWQHTALLEAIACS